MLVKESFNILNKEMPSKTISDPPKPSSDDHLNTKFT